MNCETATPSGCDDDLNAVGARAEFPGNIPWQGDVSIIVPAMGLQRRVHVAW